MKLPAMRWDQVLIEPEVTSSKTIIVTTSATDKERPCIGKVLSIGPGVDRDGKLERLDAKVGDRVLFNPFPCTDWPVNGKHLCAVSQRQIVGVF